MQFYQHDFVIVNDGIVDDHGADIGGMKGHISNIGFRNTEFPITVDVLNPETGLYSEYYFKASELKRDPSRSI